jgi:predicted CopG family antitoxin
MLLEKVRKRSRSKTISISLELWEKIVKVCDNNISVSSFIKMAIINELKKRGIYADE